jgi:hypothetical protein
MFCRDVGWGQGSTAVAGLSGWRFVGSALVGVMGFTGVGFWGFVVVWRVCGVVWPVFGGCFRGFWVVLGWICVGTCGRVMSSESPLVRQPGAESRGGRPPLITAWKMARFWACRWVGPGIGS